MKSNNPPQELGTNFQQDLAAWSQPLALPRAAVEAMERLGIETNAKLASSDPDALSFWIGIPSSVTRRWHDAATRVLAGEEDARRLEVGREEQILANWIQTGTEPVDQLLLAANALGRQQIRPLQ